MKEYIMEASDKGMVTKVKQELVRCRECEFGHHLVNAANGEVRAYRVACKPTKVVHEPDWFCADGRRRE